MPVALRGYDVGRGCPPSGRKWAQHWTPSLLCKQFFTVYAQGDPFAGFGIAPQEGATLVYALAACSSYLETPRRSYGPSLDEGGPTVPEVGVSRLLPCRNDRAQIRQASNLWSACRQGEYLWFTCGHLLRRVTPGEGGGGGGQQAREGEGRRQAARQQGREGGREGGRDREREREREREGGRQAAREQGREGGREGEREREAGSKGAREGGGKGGREGGRQQGSKGEREGGRQQGSKRGREEAREQGSKGGREGREGGEGGRRDVEASTRKGVVGAPGQGGRCWGNWAVGHRVLYTSWQARHDVFWDPEPDEAPKGLDDQGVRSRETQLVAGPPAPAARPRLAAASAPSPAPPPAPPRRNSGLWCVSTRRDQHKAQKEIWLVSGLQDHRYLSVNKDAKMPVDGPLKRRNAVKTRRYVQNHRHAGLTGSICQPVTEFTYNWKRHRPLPPPPALSLDSIGVPLLDPNHVRPVPVGCHV